MAPSTSPAAAGLVPLLAPPVTSELPRSWLQRAAARPLPDPGALLLLLAVGGGCICLLGRGPTSGLDGMGHAANAAAGSAVDLAVMGPPGYVPVKGRYTAIAVAAFVTVAWLVACQYACDFVIKTAFRGALRAMDVAKLGLDVETGPLHSCFFRGSLELRRCIVRNPRGFDSDRLLEIRCVTVDFNIWRLLTSFGGELAIRGLSLDGVTVTVETRAGVHSPEDGSNVQEALSQLACLPLVPPQKAKFSLQKVAATDLVVNAFAGATSQLPPITYQDFSVETDSYSIERAIARLSADLGHAAMAAARPDGI